MSAFKLTIFTSDTPMAGTDALVGISLFDEEGIRAGTTVDSAKKGVFERASVDVVRIESYEEMGEIVKVKVGHNGKGSGSEWQLDKIEIRRVANESEETVEDLTTFYFNGKVIRKGKQYEGLTETQHIARMADKAELKAGNVNFFKK